MPQRYAVRIRVAADAARVERTVGRWGEVTPVHDGAVLEMNVDSLAWPVMVLAEVGAPFVVESPDELRDHCARVAEIFGSASS
jgi:predicted DNA-binding transcriptional regulator YafY